VEERRLRFLHWGWHAVQATAHWNAPTVEMVHYCPSFYPIKFVESTQIHLTSVSQLDLPGSRGRLENRFWAVWDATTLTVLAQALTINDVDSPANCLLCPRFLLAFCSRFS